MGLGNHLMSREFQKGCNLIVARVSISIHESQFIIPSRLCISPTNT